MAQWTNKYDILEDLSLAQGRVPVALDRTLGAGDKPPKLVKSEETEEEFFKHYTGDPTISTPPDLHLIQKMLDLVRDVNDISEEEEITSKPVVVTKPKNNQFKSCISPIKKQKSDNISTSQPKQTKHKKHRNIAVESILQAIADNKPNKEIILRKPDDFITVDSTPQVDRRSLLTQEDIFSNISEAPNYMSSTPTPVEKVTGWFETLTDNPFQKKTPKLTLEPGNFTFKKKEKLKNSGNVKAKNNLKNDPSSSNSSEYKPSALANEYYQKYLERNKFKQNIKENIWRKAERKMKELDEKRCSEAMQAVKSPSNGSEMSGLNQSFEEIQSTDIFTKRVVAETKISRCLDLVALSQHRHQLCDDCIVCDVMSRKRETTQTETLQEDVNEEIDDVHDISDTNEETSSRNTLIEELEDIEKDFNNL